MPGPPPGGFHQPARVPEPLDGGPGDKDRAFQGVFHLTVDAPGDSRQEPVARLDWRGSRVHKSKTAGSIGSLNLPRAKAGLAEECSLLIPRDPRDGNLHIGEVAGGVPEDPTGGKYKGIIDTGISSRASSSSSQSRS